MFFTPPAFVLNAHFVKIYIKKKNWKKQDSKVQKLSMQISHKCLNIVW